MVTLLILGSLVPPLLLVLSLRNPFRRESVVRFLRTPLVDRGLFLVAAAIFLGKICHLGQADFGDCRLLLFFAFALLAIAALRISYGFLASRALAILQLLWANELLKAGMGYYGPLWLAAKLYAYCCVLLASYLTIYPYRLRDWLCRRARR
ncbi:MAG: hypothetical protein LBH53_00680 [Puniceicoccales bacterium]|jgi:hypothetical protein|nr:hypothetical protein [Puniceicoccales bacterium]